MEKKRQIKFKSAFSNQIITVTFDDSIENKKIVRLETASTEEVNKMLLNMKQPIVLPDGTVLRQSSL